MRNRSTLSEFQKRKITKGWINVEDIGLEREDKQDVRGMTPPLSPWAEGAVKRNLIENARSHYRGNISRAAREHGVSRPLLHTPV